MRNHGHTWLPARASVVAILSPPAKNATARLMALASIPLPFTPLPSLKN